MAEHQCRANKSIKYLVYERIYPDINPFLHYRTLPALDVQSWQDDFTNLYLHIIVSISATHKAVQSRQQGSAVCLSREVYQYRSYALRRLNQRLRNPKAQLDDLTFICVLTLSLAEVSYSQLSKPGLTPPLRSRVTDLGYASFNNLLQGVGLPTSRERREWLS